MQYLLDSDTCIAFFKGKYNVPEKIESVGFQNCFVSEITILELTYGALNSEQVEKHRNEVTLLEELFTVIPIMTAKEIFSSEKASFTSIRELDT